MAERIWVDSDRPSRPDWLTDEEVAVVIERTNMAMVEAGVVVEWRPAENPREAFVGDRPITEAERRIFRRARRMAMASIGAVIVDECEMADA